ncbi:MAG: phosphotransacetylase family protein [Chloroflexaceae bacterium]
MATLYIASTETFVGKSAVCLGLLNRMRRDGFAVGYMKPVSVSVAHTSTAILDEDAAFIRKSLQLDTPIEQTAPVLLTPSVIESIMQGQSPSFERKLQEAYLTVSREKDIVVLEGTNNWAEGALVDLSADQVADMLEASALLISRYTSTRAIDTILTVQRYVGDRLIGVLLNQVAEPQLDFIQKRVVPFLESRGVPVMGILPHDRFLASISVSELHEHLGGQLIGNPAWVDRVVDSLMIGAMGADAGLSYFRRRTNKAVITGGDRVDLQLVALETSTSVLILTGNIRPSTRITDLAEERQVPILVVPDDTLSTVERAEELFGRIRFHQEVKMQRFNELMDEHFDFPQLYQALGVAKG